MNKYLVKTLKVSLFILGVALLFLCVFWLPHMAKASENLILQFSYLKFFIVIIIFHTFISLIIAIRAGFHVLQLDEEDLYFTEEACKTFNGIISSAIGIIVLFVTGIVYLTAKKSLSSWMHILGIVIVLIVFIIASLAAAFKIFLQKMVQVKEEKAKMEKENKILS